MGCIYMRTSPSGKRYIGMTTIPEKTRWRQHCSNAYRVNCSDYNTPLSKAIRKYGANSFICTILEDNIEDIELLKQREIYWIEHYGTFRKELNATRGGDGNRIADTKKIIELWNKGHCVRDICILLGVWPFTVLSHLNLTPQEAENRGPVYISKNSAKHFGDYKIGRGVEISCYNIKTGMLIKTFSSFYLAAKFVGAKSSASIMRACKGQSKTAYGYFWKLGKNDMLSSIDVIHNAETRKQRVSEYVICVETNTMYADTKCAEFYTGICYRSILFACKGHQKTAGKLHWRYATNEDKMVLPLTTREKTYHPAPNNRSVICVETGNIYSSLRLAGESIGLGSSAIYNCCRGRTKTAGGFHWKYAELRKE